MFFLFLYDIYLSHILASVLNFAPIYICMYAPLIWFFHGEAGANELVGSTW
jgi:hypothetical protein